MTLAAIGNADDKGPVDCSSIRLFASKRMRLSMAASFSAHIAIAAYLATAIAPHGINTATSAKAFNITLVNLDTPDVAPKITAPAETEQYTAAKPLPAVTRKAVTPPVNPVEAPRPVPIAKKSPAPAPKISEPVSPPSNAQLASPEASDAAVSSLQADHTGSLAAPQTSTGQPERPDLTIINEARYRSPPTPPRYPKRSRELNQQGEALLHIRLDPQGKAEEILVWQSSGYVLLDNAALAAARRWEFEPERRGGRAVIAWVKIPVRFSLH